MPEASQACKSSQRLAVYDYQLSNSTCLWHRMRHHQFRICFETTPGPVSLANRPSHSRTGSSGMKSLSDLASTSCPLMASTWQCATNSQGTLIIGYHSLGGLHVLVRGNSSHRVTFTSWWHYSVGARARWPSYSHNQVTEWQSTGPQAGAGLAEWSTGCRSWVKYLMAPGYSCDWPGIISKNNH